MPMVTWLQKAREIERAEEDEEDEDAAQLEQ
jgi:hypothetical protein